MSNESSQSVGSGAVIVFDGVCALCNGWVKFLLRHDHGQRYRFAAMQSSSGRDLLSSHGLDPDDPVSFLLVADGRTWTDSDAILRVLASLGGLWRTLEAGRLVPRGLRDPLYRLVARNRYRWFARYDTCLVPAPAQRGDSCRNPPLTRPAARKGSAATRR